MTLINSYNARHVVDRTYKGPDVQDFCAELFSAMIAAASRTFIPDLIAVSERMAEALTHANSAWSGKHEAEIMVSNALQDYYNLLGLPSCV